MVSVSYTHLDVYKRQQLHWSETQFGYRVGNRHEDLSFSNRNSAPGMPKCQVVDTAFLWGDDRSPHIPWHDTVIYELHVRGFTMRHPEIPPHLRGTYALSLIHI